MAHRSSSRGGGAGGKIQTLELTAPIAITSGTEYFLTSEGSLVTQADVSPFVATPLVGSNLGVAGSNYSWGNTAAGSLAFMQHDLYTVGTSNYPVCVVQFSAQYEAYVTRPASGATELGYVTCYVYDKLTGELVAEGLFQLGAGDNISYPRPNHWIAIVPSGTNKFCLVCDYTTNSGSSWNYRVGEVTFNGTNAVSFAWKTALGSAANFIGQFCGIGTGVSSGKIAVKRDTTYSIINVVANTINSAAGFTGLHQVEGQWGLSFNSTSTCSVTNYETNGSSSFTVTGSAILNGDQSVKLTPTVYLQGISQLNQSPNILRLVVFNAGYTAAACTLLNHPVMAELTNPVVIQPKSGVLEFIVTSSWANGANSTESASALVFTINSSGAVVKAPKVIQLDATTRTFMRNLFFNFFNPVKLDMPVWHISNRPQNTTDWSLPDAAASLIVKFRPDFYLGQFKPKYLGRALVSVAQGATASFAASPSLLAVDPAQTNFVRVGRVIKVNDLQGFFLDYNIGQFGIVSKLDNSSPAHAQSIDETGLNYPWVVGQSAPAENGKLYLNALGAGTIYTIRALVVTPAAVNLVDISNTASMGVALEVSFSGFLVFAMRANVTAAATYGYSMTLEAEEADYV